MCLAIAAKPIVKIVSTIVANRKPPGTPMPLPQPRPTGTLKLIAVIGAAFAIAMNSTDTNPTAPLRRPFWLSLFVDMHSTLSL